MYYFSEYTLVQACVGENEDGLQVFFYHVHVPELWKRNCENENTGCNFCDMVVSYRLCACYTNICMHFLHIFVCYVTQTFACVYLARFRMLCYTNICGYISCILYDMLHKHLHMYFVHFVCYVTPTLVRTSCVFLYVIYFFICAFTHESCWKHSYQNQGITTPGYP